MSTISRTTSALCLWLGIFGALDAVAQQTSGEAAAVATASEGTAETGARQAATPALTIRPDLEHAADKAYRRLVAERADAAAPGEAAVAALIFPAIYDVAVIAGGEFGLGVLRVDDKTEGYFQTLTLSLGAQAGFETHSVALLFMDHGALDRFLKEVEEDGFQMGGDLEAVDWDDFESAETGEEYGIFGFVYDREGVMMEASIELQTITRLAR